MIWGFIKDKLSSLATPLLVTACIALMGVGIAQALSLSASAKNLREARDSLTTVSADLVKEQAKTAEKQATIDRVEAARETERTQAAEDFAGLVMQQKDELKRAVAAASATASLTGKCPPLAKTQAERRAAWDALHGASK
jgi:peptidoglycan hydrolase CwlO-like protein